MSDISLRFSFSKKVATGTGTMARISRLNSFCASSSTNLNIDRARDRVPRMVPCPLQRGHVRDIVSSRDGRSLCRDISNKPKREIRPTCTRARSTSRASRILFSTSFWWRLFSISIKSITISPPTSRKRNWRAISSAASLLVLNAVSSISPPLVARAELISIETKASVISITIDPPEGKLTSRQKAVSI